LHQQLCAIDTRFIHSPYYWRLGIPDLGQDIGAYKAAELIRSGRGVILLTKVGGNDTHRERDMRKLDHQVEYLAVRVYSFRDLWRANAAQGLTAVNTDSSLTFIEREHLATLRRFEGRAACGFSTAWPAIHKLLKAYPPVGVRISAYEALRELQAHRQVVLINRDGLDVTVDNLRALRGLGAGNTD